MSRLRYTMFVVTVLLALALSAMITVPALADDSVPPPVSPSETVQPAEEILSPEVPTASDVAQIPEGTELVVTDSEGVSIPLATQQAADAIVTGDPVWCPAGVAPQDGTGGCTDSYATLYVLTNDIANNTIPAPAANGVIWIKVGADTSASPIVIDGSDIDLDTWENFSLTLNGGWDGTFGSTAITGTSTLNQGISILSWNNKVTLNNIVIDGAGGTGLAVTTYKDITLNNVDVTNSGSWGANLDNSFGTANIVIKDSTFSGNGTGLAASAGMNMTLNNVDVTNNNGFGAYLTNGNIVVEGSTFSGNSGTGLTAFTNKIITLSNVDVVNNSSGVGAHLDNSSGGSNVVINDSTFNGNSNGLSVASAGVISIKNLSVNNNLGDGAYFQNSYTTSPKAVILSGSNNFNFNGEAGLIVISEGAITLSNVTAIYNGHSGVELNNCFYNDSSGFCGSVASTSVTIKGASNFSNNGWDGLRVWSSGAITMGNITANNNGTDAARPGQIIDYDAYGKGVFLHNFGSYSPKAITITGTNTFSGNASSGLFAYGWGKITVSNLTANNNGCDALKENITYCHGARLDGSGITLTGYGVFNGNDADGLSVNSYGAAILNNLYADGNGAWGAFIDSYGPPSVVSLLGTNTFINNLEDGLFIWSDGVVTLNNVTANDNAGQGVYVDNATKFVFDPILGPIEVPAGKVITLNGTNFFNGNTGFGLELHSSGGITTNNVTALFNGDDGVYLVTCLYDATPDDCTGLVNKNVTMNGNNNMNFNIGDGLYIESLGTIKVNNLTATFNGGSGTILDNNWTAAVGGVTITGFANTSFNNGPGLGIYSRGAVLTSNLTASSNNPASALAGQTFYDGVFINNATNPLKLMNVTLLGTNQFNDNWNSGLQISSYGMVVLNNITANNNGEPFNGTTNPTPAGDGVKVDNSDASSAKAVTLNGVNIFDGNLDYGSFIQSIGTIVVNKVTANNNGLNGAYLDNRFDFINSAVTLLGYGMFDGNGSTGLVVYSNGNVILNNIAANNSTGGGGAYIDIYSNTATPVSVTVLGVNSFSGNAGASGLVVFSDGAITLNNITASDNDGNGVHLNNTNYQIPLKTGNITLNGTNTFVNNIWNGLEFAATGNVIMTRVTADFNNDGVIGGGLSAGILGTAGGTITLTCGSMNLNEGAGYSLTAGTGKLITLKGVFTYGNGLIDVSSSPTVSTRTCPLP